MEHNYCCYNVVVLLYKGNFNSVLCVYVFFKEMVIVLIVLLCSLCCSNFSQTRQVEKFPGN